MELSLIPYITFTFQNRSPFLDLSVELSLIPYITFTFQNRSPFLELSVELSQDSCLFRPDFGSRLGALSPDVSMEPSEILPVDIRTAVQDRSGVQLS